MKLGNKPTVQLWGVPIQSNIMATSKFQKVSRFSKKIMTGSLSAAEWSEEERSSGEGILKFKFK